MIFNSNFFSTEAIIATVLGFFAFTVCITVTEILQALLAKAWGDSTAEEEGWLDINPLTHITFFNTLLLVTLHFGWLRFIPLHNKTKYSSSLVKFIAITFSQVLFALILACMSLSSLILMLGKTCLDSRFIMFFQTHIPISELTTKIPGISSLKLLFALFLIAVTMYGIFIATFSFFINVFRAISVRFFALDGWNDRSRSINFIIVQIFSIFFLAGPLYVFLLKAVLYAALIFGHLFGKC